MTTQTIPDVGAAVRAEMGRQRVNMLELARRTGIPRTTLADQVNRSNLTVNNFVLITRSLGVAAGDLLGEVAA
jgi:hypothetical protein